jgi:hypothetical protein
MSTSVRLALAVSAAVVVMACGREPPQISTNAAPAAPPNDAAHQALAGPHGDHTPRHAGLVLMQGDVHYEVVLRKDGRHQIWFSDAVRNDLPASVAAKVTMEIARPNAPVESVTLAIDDNGEAWQADGRPLEGEGTMVKVRFSLQGDAHEIEIPVVATSLR